MEWILFGIGVIVFSVAGILIGLWVGRRWARRLYPPETPRPEAEKETQDDG
jgi:hypothetical protein